MNYFEALKIPDNLNSGVLNCITEFDSEQPAEDLIVLH